MFTSQNNIIKAECFSKICKYVVVIIFEVQFLYKI